MKKIIYILLAVAFLLLSACAGSVDTDTPGAVTTTVLAQTTTAPATTTEKLLDTNEPVTEPVTPPSAADMLLVEMQAAGCPEDRLPTIERELTAEELSAASAFLADEQALTVLGAATFYSPEEICVYGILYAQKGKEAPVEEKAAVVAKYGEEDWLADDCTKMTTAELDTLLRKYVGIGMDPSMKGDFVFYMEDYDAYYLFVTDGYGVSTGNLVGYLTTDGEYLIRFGGDYDDRTAILTPTDESFLIRQMIELKGGLSDR